jgi:hypothetical protein
MLRTALLVGFMSLVLAALCGYIVYLAHKNKSILMQDDKLKSTLTSSDIQNLNSNVNTMIGAMIGAWVLVGFIAVGTTVDYVKSYQNDLQ